jgi:hypothetical protein
MRVNRIRQSKAMTEDALIIGIGAGRALGGNVAERVG